MKNEGKKRRKRGSCGRKQDKEPSLRDKRQEKGTDLISAFTDQKGKKDGVLNQAGMRSNSSLFCEESMEQEKQKGKKISSFRQDCSIYLFQVNHKVVA
ncbi:MAG: hypothetical protein IKN64_10750 [Desulfovibrio sp.]|nr:hypothetical protein [Desulfovibrio sp.]